jgi:hypothetical protein
MPMNSGNFLIASRVLALNCMYVDTTYEFTCFDVKCRRHNAEVNIRNRNTGRVYSRRASAKVSLFCPEASAALFSPVKCEVS